MSQTKGANVIIGSRFDTAGLEQTLQKPTQSGTEPRLKGKDVTKAGRGSPVTELLNYIQPAQQIDSQVNAITLHQFNTLIQAFAEQRWRVIFEQVGQSRMARRSVKRRGRK